jgi:hypothetical protein
MKLVVSVRASLMFGLALSLALSACSDEGENADPDQPSGGSAGTGGGSAGTNAGSGGSSGAATGGAGTTGAGAPNAGAGGTPAAGKGGGGTAGSAGGGKGPGSGGAGAGGAGGALGGGGGMPNAGSGGASGGAGSGGDQGGGAGAGGSGGTGNTACTRELLQNTIDAYFEALAAGDPGTLPLADDVRFTENSEELELGAAGLWTNAGMVKYTQSALDVVQCSSGTHAVVPEGNGDIPLALRLKLENGQITEIETIAVRQGDYPPATSNPQAIIDIAEDVGWEEPVAAGDRATREELIAWMDKYFRMFPQGVCAVTSACRRLENGGGNFNCGTGSCASGQPGPNDDNMVPRVIIADEETGIGVGLTMFTTGGNFTDMHMFKMHGEQVHAVHAILGTAGNSGWE